MLVALALFGVAIAAAITTTKVRPRTGLLLSPTLVWVGLALVANVGLYLVNP